MRCVIFDLDGTLADTSGDLIAAANVALAGLGVGARLRPGADDATAFRGGRAMLDLAAVRAGLSAPDRAALVEAGYPLLLAAYGAAIDAHTRLYPGAVAAIDRLRAADVAVGICTNKPEALAEALIRRLGVRDRFASLIGADTLPVRKPDAAPVLEAIARAGGTAARACLVGDTATDRNAARAAGVISVLVGFGPDGRAVADLEPEALLHRFEELPALVDRLLP